ncbi:pteridine reductase [Pseudoteredinibacter isoporae]|uniref:Pteridine reductase n=1 Tax=Pseudoteredinibacter isoporae TaxID=570281 RepID=A0A7X0JRV6_9GAMM|nr:pteridine reductase [Pseudoteredinibacter isoporae]NHO86718.1 pteridine reductase [Pseudoteredinibacter isoporae]NIB24830.1 pteridine reductase [Pseudoteredinibacter isoporae]
MSEAPVALITGGAKRIGAALCRRFHEGGYRILLHYGTSSDAAEALANELNRKTPDSCFSIQADLNQLNDVRQLADTATRQWGRVDLLINNASSFYPTPITDCNEQHWDDLMGSNAKAPLFLSQALAPSLAERQGAIINFADIHAEKPMAGHSIYNMAKAANVMLTKSLAMELAPDIRVNGIAPGAILWPEGGEENSTVLAKIPLQRCGGEAPICQAAWYLAEQAPYTTGQVLAIDGGRSLHM